ncbi:MAG: hypothetical protein Tsb0019_16250 [Roseibium sp.]
METLSVRLYAAFAADETGGSMAAVVFEDTPLWPAARQRIAADLNAPVAAFVRPVSEDRFQVKLHSVRSEIESSSPAAVAVFSALKDTGRIASGTFVLETAAGEVAAEVAPEGSVALTLPRPVFETELPGSVELAGLFGVKVSAVAKGTVVTADLRHLLVELSDPGSLAAAQPGPETLARFFGELAFDAVALWCPDYIGIGKIKVQLRVFSPDTEAGFREQPASADVAGTLACDLVRMRRLLPAGGGQAVLVAAQGSGIGRPSILRAVVTTSGKDVAAVSAGGFAALRMSGEVVI